MITLNSEFWNKRYLDKETGWDIGYVSTPIKEYFKKVKNKELKILIPGGGNSYEAEFLFNKGFTNTFLLDYAKTPLINFKRRNPKFPSNQLIHCNFFDYQDNFDIIIEQTFFCAIYPKRKSLSMHTTVQQQSYGLCPTPQFQPNDTPITNIDYHTVLVSYI